MSTSAASPANPSPLPPRYEIRLLTDADLDAVTAIICYSNLFHSPVWHPIYGKDLSLAHKMYREGRYLVQHQIDSGLSFGVFDTQYQYKRPESAATGGKVYWDEAELADGPTLLEQLDSPLVSIALSYDAMNALDMAKMTLMVQLLPEFGIIYGSLAALDKRNPDHWKATGPGQVLMRNGTCSRPDYEGKGIMRGIAHWLMREAKLRGFRGIQIECAHTAVHHVWMHPPEPFTAELIAEFDTATYEQEGPDGVKRNPFAPGKQVCTKVYVTL